MKCTRIQDELSAFLDGELAPAQAQAIREHLDSCPACQNECDNLDITRQAVRGLPRVGAPSGFRDRMMAKLEAEQPVAAAPSRFAGLRLYWSVAAAILIAVVLTLLYPRLMTHPEMERTGPTPVGGSRPDVEFTAEQPVVAVTGKSGGETEIFISSARFPERAELLVQDVMQDSYAWALPPDSPISLASEKSITLDAPRPKNGHDRASLIELGRPRPGQMEIWPNPDVAYAVATQQRITQQTMAPAEPPKPDEEILVPTDDPSRTFNELANLVDSNGWANPADVEKAIADNSVRAQVEPIIAFLNDEELVALKQVLAPVQEGASKSLRLSRSTRERFEALSQWQMGALKGGPRFYQNRVVLPMTQAPAGQKVVFENVRQAGMPLRQVKISVVTPAQFEATKEASMQHR